MIGRQINREYCQIEVRKLLVLKLALQRMVNLGESCSALVLFVSVSWCFCWGDGCLQEERSALLQIKGSINHPNGSALSSWVGEDCCQWEEIECDPFTSHVVGIKIYGMREEGLGKWYPNASLFFQFKELSQVDLSQNQIGGQDIIQGNPPGVSTHNLL